MITIYYCPKCDDDMDMTEVRITMRAHETNLCDTCGTRGYIGKKVGVGMLGGDRNYSKPIHSDSLAINPDQIAEHRKLFPDIKVDPEGRPIFDNYRKHDDYLNKCGFVKQTQRIKPKGRRIDKPKQPSSEAYPKENQ